MPRQVRGLGRRRIGLWDTTHLDAAGSLAFAKLVVRDLRRVVPALARFLRDDLPVVLEEPPDLPAPHPLLSAAAPSALIRPRRAQFGRVYPRGLRLDRYLRRMTHNGREPDVSRLPPLVRSPAILVAWDFVPSEPPPGASGCGFGRNAPARIVIRPRSGCERTLTPRPRL